MNSDPDVLAARATDHTTRYHGWASALVRPADAAEVSAVLSICRRAGAKVTVQGGRTGLEAGTVPEHDDVLLSTERLTSVGDVDGDELRISVGAGVTLATLQRTVTPAGLRFGVDIASRDSATIGGMVATDAGGLHTVRYGHMAAQVLGLEVVLPDGTIVRRRRRVGAENCGYDMSALWTGSEGTLGVITAVDLALHRAPGHCVAALAGFADLSRLIEAVRVLRRLDGVDAVELLDGRGLELASSRLGFAVPAELPWYLLVEMEGSCDCTEELAEALQRCDPDDEPAVGMDPAGRARVWAARDAFAEVVQLFGAPVKFDAALPLDAIAAFVDEVVALVADRAEGAIPVLFGHIADGNVHLNVLRCLDESVLYRPVTELIRDHGGVIASEHGVGAHKRNYLDFARSHADISAMWAIKRALDPDDYLNPAVMFPDWLRQPN